MEFTTNEGAEGTISDSATYTVSTDANGYFE